LVRATCPQNAILRIPGHVCLQSLFGRS